MQCNHLIKCFGLQKGGMSLFMFSSLIFSISYRHQGEQIILGWYVFILFGWGRWIWKPNPCLISPWSLLPLQPWMQRCLLSPPVCLPVPSLLPQSPPPLQTHPVNFFTHPAHCLLGLSSPCLSFPPRQICLSPPLLFHSYDLGIIVAPSPFQPWIVLPCYYSVIPPARSSMSGIAELTCPLTACLSGPADWLTLTTDALGQWSLSSCGQETLENNVESQTAVF